MTIATMAADWAGLSDAELEQRLIEASHLGMTTAIWAKVKPDAVAVFDPHGTRTFAELNANANRVTRMLRDHGLKPGDAIALLCSNRAEFLEILLANFRGGFRITPVNWHLTAEEAAYVVADCQAKAFFAEVRYEAALKAAADAPMLTLKVASAGDAPNSVGGGFLRYETEIAKYDGSDIPDPVLGNNMLYTSGTTGRPKGVFRKVINALPFVLGGARTGYNWRTDVQLCSGPAYHAAPLGIDIRIPMSQGIPVVFMDGKWDSETVLKTIEKYKVTHGHMVAIMFQRLLSLPDAVKARYDLSSLRYIVHGAAPCPPEVKRAMLEWLGPIIYEYYAGSEGGGGFTITPQEWLKKPGSVGKALSADAVRILDDEGNRLDPGVAGTLYFPVVASNPFEYFNDPTKTAASHKDGYFTLGDVGYLDEDGYLFLTGRTAECIISGGVNIYPQEIDNELIKHPAVEDSCAIGVPNTEWGEEVKAVIMLRPGYQASEAMTQELLAFARQHLAGFKVPRSIDYVDDMPRSPAGKVQRGKVRAPFWAGRKVQI